MVAAQKEYARALTYIEMFHSPACWRMGTEARKRFKERGSETARREGVKEQFRIRVLGFGWKDLHEPWSVDGEDRSADYLFNVLIKTVIPAQRKRKIPDLPPIVLPSRGEKHQLGTKTEDVDLLDQRRENEKELFVKGATELREKMEMDGDVDRYEKKQPPQPAIDEKMIGAKMEQLLEYDEPNGESVRQWCKGTVVGIKSNNKVHMKWDEDCLRDGDAEITEERFMTSKWNKHVIGGWRYNFGD